MTPDDRPIGQTVKAIREALGISVMRLASLAPKESGVLGGSHIERFEAGGVLSARDWLEDIDAAVAEIASEERALLGGRT